MTATWLPLQLLGLVQVPRATQFNVWPQAVVVGDRRAPAAGGRCLASVGRDAVAVDPPRITSDEDSLPADARLSHGKACSRHCRPCHSS